MNNKYIDIYKKDGNIEKAEVLLKFYSNQYNKCYMLYKLVNDNENVYASSFLNVDGVVDLDNNLIDEELFILQQLLDNTLED